MARATIAPTLIGGVGDLGASVACMPVRRRPTPSCFRLFFHDSDGKSGPGFDPDRGVVKIEQMFYDIEPPCQPGCTPEHFVAPTPYAELHLPHQLLVPRRRLGAWTTWSSGAVELGLTGLAVTEPQRPLWGSPFRRSAAEAGRAPPGRRSRDRAARPGRYPTRPVSSSRRVEPRRPPAPPPPGDPGRSLAGPGEMAALKTPTEGQPARPRTHPRPDCPVTGPPGQGGTCGGDRRSESVAPHLVLLARFPGSGLAELMAGSSRTPNMAGTKGMPRFSQALPRRARPRAWWRCRVAVTASWSADCGRATSPGPRAVAEHYATLFRGRGDGPATSGFFIELSHPSPPRRTNWLVSEAGRIGRGGRSPGRPSTNDAHYARPEDRELGRRPERDPARPVRSRRSADLRRPDGESLSEVGVRNWRALRFDAGARRRARPGRAGISTAVEPRPRRARSISASSSTASPGFPVPRQGRPRFFRTCRSCAWAGAPQAATTR